MKPCHFCLPIKNSMQCPEDSEFLFIDHFSEALYQEALHWVNGTRRVAMISKEHVESRDSRIQIYLLESPLQKEKILKQIAWSAVFQKMHVVGSKYKKELEKFHLAAHLIVSDAAGYWVKPIANARANAAPFKRGLFFRDAFQNVPAVIVGAGPSLKKNGHLLKELKGRALIFAGGSALNAIDVEPDFAAAIDAEAPCRKYPFSEVPFCFQARVNPLNLSQMQGDKILFPDGSSNILNWLFEEEEFFDGGWTVGNFLTGVASFWGCSPIIFVGMDLCYAGGEKYTGLPNDQEACLVEVDGHFTQRDWLMAALWTRDKAQGKGWINATEGGILGLEEKRLQDLVFPERQLDVKSVLARGALHTVRRWNEWDQFLKKSQTDLQPLEDHPIYHQLLLPLWNIWQPIFEREVAKDPSQKIEHHQQMFFLNVLAEHRYAEMDSRIGDLTQLRDKLYYISGALYSRTQEDKKEYFYENGSPKTIECYADGRLSGESLLYWPNGRLKRKCSLLRGVREGWDQMLSPHGIVLDEGFYRKGEPVGVHRRCNRRGQLIEEIEYLEKPRFNLRRWDDEGQIRVNTRWVDDIHYEERAWDRFENKWVEKRGRFDGKKLMDL